MFQSFDQVSTPEHGPVRLEKLRLELKQEGLDGFIIPRADKHQGEYVAPHDERLAWLTGFTGSAGFCIALADVAGVFIDGRYRVQVKAQVAPCFTPVHWPETSPAAWLKKTLGKGVIGFDPWLHTITEIDTIKKELGASGIQLVPCDNLVDRIWDDQPMPPMGQITAYPLELAGVSYQDKCTMIAAELKTKEQAAAVITLPDSLCWLLNVRGSDVAHNPVAHGFVIINDNGHSKLFAHADKLTSLEGHFGNDVSFHSPEQLENELAKINGTIGVDGASLPIAIQKMMTNSGKDYVLGQDPCALPKARKNEVEITKARESHLRDAAVMCEFLAWVDAQPYGSLTEIDVATKLEEMRRATGLLLDISFESIVGSGPNAALPHYRVSTESNRRINEGEVLLVDSGAQYLDGTTDITRTMAVGAQPDEVKRAFTRVLKGMIAISRLKFPNGISGSDLDAFARAALWSAGQDFNHGTGHGVGHYLSVHEGPQRLSRISKVPFEKGMFLSNEPGFYKEGQFGIRTENLIIVQPAALSEDANLSELFEFETLTYVPIDRRMMVVEMMNSDEIEWINTYHQVCRDKMNSRVSQETRLWLEQATQPIG